METAGRGGVSLELQGSRSISEFRTDWTLGEIIAQGMQLDNYRATEELRHRGTQFTTQLKPFVVI